MLVAATTDPRRAALARMTSLWPTLIRRPEVPCTKGGQIDRAHQASLESATLRSLSERLTLVTAVTSTLLSWLQNPASPLQHFYGHFIIDLFKKNDGYGTSL